MCGRGRAKHFDFSGPRYNISGSFIRSPARGRCAGGGRLELLQRPAVAHLVLRGELPQLPLVALGPGPLHGGDDCDRRHERHRRDARTLHLFATPSPVRCSCNQLLEQVTRVLRSGPLYGAIIAAPAANYRLRKLPCEGFSQPCGENEDDCIPRRGADNFISSRLLAVSQSVRQ